MWSFDHTLLYAAFWCWRWLLSCYILLPNVGICWSSITFCCLILEIVRLLLYSAAWCCRPVVSCYILLPSVWARSVYCDPGKMLVGKNSGLSEDGCSIIDVFDNRMEAVTRCMTPLVAVAKRNWGGQEKYNPGVVLTVIHRHVCAQTCCCMPLIPASSGNFYVNQLFQN